MNPQTLLQTVGQRLSACGAYRAAADGTITLPGYRSYMTDVYHYALHSSQVIGLAAARCVNSHPPVAEYLFKHAVDELGHDRWARQDLLDLGLSQADIDRSRPSIACRTMLAYEYLYASHENPLGLFGWMFVLEGMGGSHAGGVAAAIDRALGLQGKGTYFLAGHGEADAVHSEELFDVVSDHITTCADIEAFETVADRSLELYIEILDGAIVGKASGPR